MSRVSFKPLFTSGDSTHLNLSGVLRSLNNEAREERRSEVGAGAGLDEFNLSDEEAEASPASPSPRYGVNLA